MFSANRLFAVFLCWLIFASPICLAVQSAEPVEYDRGAAMQAAQILGVQSQVERLLAANDANERTQETLILRSYVLRKILEGVLEVRQACNKIDLELAYAYDVMQREERRERMIFQLFNLANFAQISTFYTLEPCVRIKHYFNTSGVFTTTSGSLGILLSTSSRLYGAVAKADHVAPPQILADMIDGYPVDTTGLPPLVDKYLDSKAPYSDKSRREELLAMWKKNYHIDPSNKANLCGINDRKTASLKLLSSRILLLWSIHTFIQGFDRELLSLLKMTKSSLPNSPTDEVNSAAYSTSEVEVARLLKIQPEVNELIALKKKNISSGRRDHLELFVLERTLEGALEVQVASDKVDDELNYSYHIILADLLSTRAKWLQYNYDLNFLQSGIMGVIAGGLYLRHWTYAGDKQFVISGGIGTGLTTLAILQMHGFWRRVDVPPNSLAEVLDLQPPPEYRFSPFVSEFLNAPSPESPEGKSRREVLNDAWEQAKVTTINLDKTKNRKALADMPPHKYDTIKIVTNRNVLLQSLKKELESFQNEVLDLLTVTEGG